MSDPTTTKAAKKPINWGFYAAFVTATIAITKFFTSHRYFTEGNSAMGYTVVVTSLLIFAVSLFFMAFEIYAEEKAKDNLRVNFTLFDSMYKKFKLRTN